MKLNTYTLLVVVLLFSSCSVVKKNGYYQSRKYKSDIQVFKNKKSNKSKRSFALNDAKPIEEAAVELAFVSLIDTLPEHTHLPTIIKNSRQLKARQTHNPLVASANQTNRPYTYPTTFSQKNKTNEFREIRIKDNEPEYTDTYAKRSLYLLLIGTVLFFSIAILWPTSSALVSIAFVLYGLFVLGALIFGILNFFKNGKFTKGDKPRIVKWVNWFWFVALGVVTGLFVFMLVFIFIFF